MALQQASRSFSKRALETNLPHHCRSWHRLASTTASSSDTSDLEGTGFQDAASSSQLGQLAEAYNPVENASKREKQLPSSRYSFRPPRYYRGPLHPHQPPRPSDPASREFIPGPFSLPRAEQTYHDTIAPDLMTLSYQHWEPGFEAPPKAQRLRQWVGDSPYYKNRPLRGPRGGDVLRLLRKRITFRNVPQLERITVHSTVSDVVKEGSAPLHIAGMALQAITNVRANPHQVKKSLASFGIKARQYISVSCDLRGENMYHFLGKLVDVVLPRIKDWRGIKGSSGDSSGNLAFGLTPDEVAFFPEISINFDMYPPKKIPGCHVILHTTARTDRDARQLLMALGFPFYGRKID